MKYSAQNLMGSKCLRNPSKWFLSPNESQQNITETHKYEHSPHAGQMCRACLQPFICSAHTGCLWKVPRERTGSPVAPLHPQGAEARASLRGAKLPGPAGAHSKPSSDVSQGKGHHGTNLLIFITASQFTFVTRASSSDQSTPPLVRSLSSLPWQPPDPAALTSQLKNLSSQPWHLGAASFLALLCLRFRCEMGR